MSTPPMMQVGLAGAVATAAFAVPFGGARERFWNRLTGTGLVLGTLAISAEPANRRPRIRAIDVVGGLVSAAALYAIFHVGDRVARAVLPGGAREIDEIYSLRGTRPAAELVARLAAVIGPAEELFWRGYIQRRLAATFGRWPAAAMATAAYAGVHVPSGNLTLIGAAGTAGAFWSFLRALGMPLAGLVVSHVAWDIWIFLVAPTRRRG